MRNKIKEIIRWETGDLREGWNENKARFIILFVMLVTGFILEALFSCCGSAFFPGYRTFSAACMNLLSQISGVIPYSVFDVLAFLVVVAIIGFAVRMIVTNCSFWRWFVNLMLFVSAVTLLYTCVWDLNDFAPPLSNELGLEVEGFTEDELFATTQYYYEQAAAYAPGVERDSETHTIAPQDFDDLAHVCGTSYVPLSQENAVFAGSTMPVKKMALSGDLLLYLGSNGLFVPYTGEANVPPNCANVDLPFTMCHEVAHRLGIPSEKEANFCAFLACTRSDDPRLLYAGYYKGFSYCYNALYEHDPERAHALLNDLLAQEDHPQALGLRLVLIDAMASNKHYQTYEGVANDVGIAVNDVSLKMSGQTSGIQSYGEVVDYLIAWHLQRD